MDLKRRDILLGEGKRALETREYKKAQNFFQEVVEIEPSNVEAHFQLANTFHIMGALSKSIRAFRRVLELDPSHTDAAISLSVLLNDIGKYDEASKVFESANKQVKSSPAGVEDEHINKKFSLKHFELGEMYTSYQRYDEALREYQKAIQLDDKDLQIRLKVAKLYSKKGYTNKAIEELKRLKSESPNYLPAKISLGLLYYGNGNVIEAESEWLSVLSRDPSNSEVRRYLQLSREATETKAF